MILRWYHSRLFWSGLVGAVVLGWSWPATREKSGEIGYAQGTLRACVGYDRGTVGISFMDHANNPFSIHPPRPGVSFRSLDMRGGFIGSNEISRPWFPRMVRIHRSGVGVNIAIWLMLLIYLAVWIAGMVVWQRRKRYLMADPLLITGTPP